jgi:hypothetical protein
VAHLRRSYEVSQRRACSVIGTDRSSIRYRSSRPDDAMIRMRLRELAAVRRRFGCESAPKWGSDALLMANRCAAVRIRESLQQHSLR